MEKQELGIIGLGRMGGGLAHRALERGMRVVGLSSGGAPDDLKDAGLIEVDNVAGLSTNLSAPRLVFLYISAGPVVDSLLDELERSLQRDDIVADGGNSYWGDSIRRYQRLRAKGLHFVDVGTSGGISGARHGACFMVGGDRAPVARIEPVLEVLATEHGYVHAGPPGSGHFVKLVHNGIQFGMLQAIGEGFDVLQHYHQPLDITAVLECWRHGSVIRSWLIDLLTEAYREDPKLGKPGAYIGRHW